MGAYATKGTGVDSAYNHDDLEEMLGVTTPTIEQLGGLSKVIDKALDLQNTIESMSEAVKAMNEELLFLTTRLIPDSLAEAGTSTFVTKEGVKVEVKDFIRGSLPKDDEKRALALAWLVENDAAEIIKNNITLTFTKGEFKNAESAKQILVQAEIPFEEKEDIHPQTLYAFARELMKANKIATDELDLLGLYTGKQAKITKPKGK